MFSHFQIIQFYANLSKFEWSGLSVHCIAKIGSESAKLKIFDENDEKFLLRTRLGNG